MVLRQTNPIDHDPHLLTNKQNTETATMSASGKPSYGCQ